MGNALCCADNGGGSKMPQDEMLKSMVAGKDANSTMTFAQQKVFEYAQLQEAMDGRTLVLHFDVNETIMVGDKVSKETFEDCLNKIIAKNVHVMERRAGEAAFLEKQGKFKWTKWTWHDGTALDPAQRKQEADCDAPFVPAGFDLHYPKQTAGDDVAKHPALFTDAVIHGRPHGHHSCQRFGFMMN